MFHVLKYRPSKSVSYALYDQFKNYIQLILQNDIHTHTKFIIFCIYITKKFSFAEKSIAQIKNKFDNIQYLRDKNKSHSLYSYAIFSDLNTIIYLTIENMEKYLF